MINIFSRLYENAAAAESVRTQLLGKGFPSYMLRVVTGEGTEAKLVRADVKPETAAAYAGETAKGKAVLVVTASYKPLGAAKVARAVLGASPAIAMDGVDELNTVRSQPDHAPSVLKEHPRFFTHLPAPEDRGHGRLSDALGWKTISKRKPRTSAISGGRFMSRAFWPMPLLKEKRKANSAISGGAYMSTKFWPQKLVSGSDRKISVIRGGGTPFSRMLGWPTTTSARD